MDWILFAVFFAACCGAAVTGGAFPPGDWYDRLDKPSWTPPNWLFPVAWTALYIALAVAGARLAPLEGSALAMAFWAMQIAWNALWTPIFFGLRKLGAALAALGVLWIAVAGLLWAAWPLDRLSFWILTPYLVWVSYAGALNLSIWLRNRDTVGDAVA